MQDELLLAETFRESMSMGWSQLQWWASVSFGLLALASFGRKYLGLPAIIGLSVLYFSFTTFTMINVMLISDVANAAVRDLQSLRDSQSISAVGADIASSVPEIARSALLLAICFFATFFGVLVYLWYAYFKNKRDNV